MHGGFLDQWLTWLQHAGGDTPDGQAPWQGGLRAAMQQMAHHLRQQANWQDALSDQTRDLLDGLRHYVEEADQVSRRLADWLQQVAGGSADPGSPEAAALLGPLLCQWPALGLTACRDREWRQLREALPEFQRAQRDYGICLLQMSEDASRRWREDLTASDEPPDAERLEQAWLAALESAWQELLQDPAYQRCLRRLNTALAALRDAGGRLLEDVLQMFRLPTRRDLLSTQQRLQQLRRQMPDPTVPVELAELQADVQRLRTELAALRRQVAAHQS
ncbi:hypothetical protein M0534_07620 [Methylonatrum kenyense]|uniref:poly(R)-hydroxyalkanoic acid synthase subunit PhaE n=1 Tax=Methylonatrum kenyense TaxID=455253 RepID=UPI0020BFD9D7|nr:poly(R)-hydroxyalkanoic acid synthase subunit PhaE [Methylonatrum kenyense]MCK8516192.1 hypothetical protein [Methylonatrum kenyense]